MEINDSDIDILNHQNDIISNESKYYTPHQFKSAYPDNKNKLCFLNTNIRSIPKNFTEFKLFLSDTKYQFSVIGITETWLSCSNVKLYSLDAYKHEYNVRKKKTGEVYLFL